MDVLKGLPLTVKTEEDTKNIFLLLQFSQIIVGNEVLLNNAKDNNEIYIQGIRKALAWLLDLKTPKDIDNKLQDVHFLNYNF